VESRHTLILEQATVQEPDPAAGIELLVWHCWAEGCSFVCGPDDLRAVVGHAVEHQEPVWE
jgi:hypothetical protein